MSRGVLRGILLQILHKDASRFVVTEHERNMAYARINGVMETSITKCDINGYMGHFLTRIWGGT